MPRTIVDGREYWAGHHPNLGLIVHSDRWQASVTPDNVRLLVVSDGWLGTFGSAAIRQTMGRQPVALSCDETDDIKKALRTMAGSQPVSYRPQRALELLQKGTGISDATFRPGQEEAVRHVVEGRGRLLVVERTGWGKSFIYFIAIRLLREAGRGPALLVSPLLSLMRNQIDAARRMGVRAAMITHANREERPEVEAALDRDEVDILLIAPERFADERFLDKALAGIADRVSLLVIDECHCISDWGHDFRPDYQLIERWARRLPSNARLLATTATANNRVMDDLRKALGPDVKVQRGPLARPSLALQTIRLPQQSQRLAWLAEQLPRIPGHGIIYALTKRDAEQVADWVQERGIDVKAYTGPPMKTEKREELERALLNNRVKALVATVALGMGFDKPDLGFVIHYQTPGSVVAYYQQVGRAGRALENAYGVLLSGDEETDITQYFIATAFPTREEAEQVITALEKAPGGLAPHQLQRQVNLTRGRISRTAKLLSLESPPPIVKDGAKWQLTAANLKDSFWGRVDRLTQLRIQEQRQMQEYVDLEGGHMEFLIGALDGETEGIRPSGLPQLPTEVNPQTERDALAFLRRLDLPIPPRLKWLAGGFSHAAAESWIPKEHRAETGRALSLWGDGGWGEMVKRGKQKDGRFADDLVAACRSLVKRWNPNPVPQWVTCIPSRRNPGLVPDFAERLARALELPFRPVLVKTEDRPPQKEMENSVQQARNVDGSLAVSAQRVPPTPVLLVDDIVGSRWTFTVAAWLLRMNGSGTVRPLALSSLGRS